MMKKHVNLPAIVLVFSTFKTEMEVFLLVQAGLIFPTINTQWDVIITFISNENICETFHAAKD